MVFKLFFFFFLFVFFLELSIRSESCLTNCGNQEINFPFQLTNQPYEHRCGYPGFDLSCHNHSQTIITFPSSCNFSVQMIDYYRQYIGIGDPAGCLAKRLLEGFDPSGTPFEQLYLLNFTLLNCTTDIPTLLPFEVTLVSCLSGENNPFVAIPVDRPDLFKSFSSCLKIGTVSLSVPESRKAWEYLSDRIWLTWKEPDCKWCLRNQGTCQFKKTGGMEVGCSVAIYHGSSTNNQYFILFIVVTLLFPFGFLIEMYPTTLLGESRELPKPNDTTCSICLLKYQTKDTLRTIPNCMHYFHANCIDEWLKLNPTCPLCRD